MTLWGGRFAEKPDDGLWAYTVDHSDRRLLLDDIAGSAAHVTMLGETGIITVDESEALRSGLVQIEEEAVEGTFEFTEGDEDVHSAVERRLVELVGEVGAKLHTGRSRNDQIALDIRLHLRRMASLRIAELSKFALTLAGIAEDHAETPVASYTHLQQAQVVPLGHHLLAYAWMAVRDRSRFFDLLVRLSESPLGASASGGSSLPLDPEVAASALGMEGTFDNSLDAVGSRDLVAEYVFCATQAMVNLSRLSEELILWATSEFSWVTFADRHTTGSSALPQKKNPDMAELARGRSAEAIGAMTTILTLQKALPLAYNRDLQGDKTQVFRVDDLLSGTLIALTAMLDGAEFHPPAPSSWTSALDLAEILVRRGVPFRHAHGAVGELVGRLVESGHELADVTVDELTAAHDAFRPEDIESIDPLASMQARSSPGGGSPQSVHTQLTRLRELLGD
ncbi:MAG: argininosuccinate lyase [Acidimicrobiia bacterium]|nr:argininosuccinate lyase [Acidimicrobiia bacterium]